MRRAIWILLVACAAATWSVFAAEEKAKKAETPPLAKPATSVEESAQGGGEEDVPDMSEAEVLALLNKVLPAARKALDELKAQDKNAYDNEIQEWAYDLPQYKEALDDNPDFAAQLLKTAALRSDCRIVAGQCRRSTTKEAKDSCRAKLKTLVSQTLAAQIAGMEAEIHSHEVEIQDIKKRIAKKKAVQGADVEKRVTALINDEDDAADWDSDDESEGDGE
jgi:hypothetical protein